MTIDFDSLLTEEQKKNILTQRITQFATEAFQHQLNKKAAEKIGDSTVIANSDEALTTLETAILIHQEQLDLLP